MPDDTKSLAVSIRPLGPAPEIGNRLLAGLSDEDLSAIAEDRVAQLVAAGQILLDAEDVPDGVIFPVAGTVLAVLALLPDRRPVETVLIGSEGAAGALFGPQEAGLGARVQVLTPGAVIRIDAARFGEALERSTTLRSRMGRYVTALLAQLQQAAACAALHPVEARASRWMLTLQDRLGDRSLPLTQEALADLLGVRRTTITRVVAALEERGVVRHRRGRIIVMDRNGLAQASCPCHRLVRNRFEAIVPGLYPPPFSDSAA